MNQDISPHTGHELAQQTTFDRTVAIVLDTLSPTSRRVYGRTYRAWRQFAAEHGFDVMALWSSSGLTSSVVSSLPTLIVMENDLVTISAAGPAPNVGKLSAWLSAAESESRRGGDHYPRARIHSWLDLTAGQPLRFQPVITTGRFASRKPTSVTQAMPESCDIGRFCYHYPCLGASGKASSH